MYSNPDIQHLIARERLGGLREEAKRFHLAQNGSKAAARGTHPLRYLAGRTLVSIGNTLLNSAAAAGSDELVNHVRPAR